MTGDVTNTGLINAVRDAAAPTIVRHRQRTA